MRHLGWLSGLLLVISCSVNPVQNPDGSGAGGGGLAGATSTGRDGHDGHIGGQAGTAATGSGGQAGTSVTGVGRRRDQVDRGNRRRLGRARWNGRSRWRRIGRAPGRRREQLRADRDRVRQRAAGGGRVQPRRDRPVPAPGRHLAVSPGVQALRQRRHRAGCAARPCGWTRTAARQPSRPLPGHRLRRPRTGDLRGHQRHTGGPERGAGPGGSCSSAGVTNNSR